MANTHNKQSWLHPLIREHLDWLLERNNGNVAAAAKEGDIPLRSFWNWMSKLDIDPDRYRDKGSNDEG